MKMITIEEGSREMLPWIKAEIEPALGFWPFHWWYEVYYYDINYELDGKKTPCWVHYDQKDGGAFGLWRTMRKAREAVLDVWMELQDPS